MTESNLLFAGEPTPTITRVEEDWVVFIERPDSDISAPQITNIISPTASTDSAFGLLELNHRSGATFRPGGLQMQSWVGDFKSDYVEAGVSSTLRIQKDKLQYTVVMKANLTIADLFQTAGRERLD